MNIMKIRFILKKKCFELKIDSEDLFDRIESKVGTYWKDFFEKK